MRSRKGRTLNRGSYVEWRVASSRCVRCVSQVETVLVQFKKPCLRHDVTDPRICEARIRGPVTPQAWLSLHPHHCQYRQVGTHFCRSSCCFFDGGIRCAPSCDLLVGIPVGLFGNCHNNKQQQQQQQQQQQKDWGTNKKK